MKGYLFPALSMSPTLLAGFIKRIPASRLDERLDPDRFTPREVIAHMSDWEPIMQERMATAVRAPGSEIIGIDEWERGLAVGYSTTDVDVSITEFEAARTQTIDWLKSLSDKDLSATFNHSELGPMTVREYATNMLGHDVYHMEQLSHYVD